MNRYISQGFLKWLFWYILNLYGKLPLLVKKFLQKDQFKGPKKEKKNVDFATFLKSPYFLDNESIDFVLCRLCGKIV